MSRNRRFQPNKSGGTRNEKVERPARARFSNWTPPWLNNGRKDRRDRNEPQPEPTTKKAKQRAMFGPKAPKRVQAPSYLLDPVIAAARASRAKDKRTAEQRLAARESLDRKTRAAQIGSNLPWKQENLISITMSQANQQMVIDLLSELEADFADGNNYFLEDVELDTTIEGTNNEDDMNGNLLSTTSSTTSSTASSSMNTDFITAKPTTNNSNNSNVNCDITQWSCQTCTFINTAMSHLTCSMCGSERNDNKSNNNNHNNNPNNNHSNNIIINNNNNNNKYYMDLNTIYNK